jgi:hypothetical protein
MSIPAGETIGATVDKPQQIKGLRLDPLSIVGSVAILAAVAMAAIGHFRPQEAWWGVAALLLAAGGSGLAVRPRTWALVVAAVGLLVAGTAIGSGWTIASWPGLGLGLGAVVRWGLGRPRPVLSVAAGLTIAAYGESALIALVLATQGRGLAWVFIQGLGSLLLGAWLSREATMVRLGLTDPPWRYVARGLLIAGVVLPYAALFVAGVRQLL